MKNRLLTAALAAGFFALLFKAASWLSMQLWTGQQTGPAGVLLWFLGFAAMAAVSYILAKNILLAVEKRKGK